MSRKRKVDPSGVLLDGERISIKEFKVMEREIILSKFSRAFKSVSVTKAGYGVSIFCELPNGDVIVVENIIFHSVIECIDLLQTRPKIIL